MYCKRWRGQRWRQYMHVVIRRPKLLTIWSDRAGGTTNVPNLRETVSQTTNKTRRGEKRNKHFILFFFFFKPPRKII